MIRFADTKEFARTIARVGTVLKDYSWCLIGGRAVEMRVNPPQTPDLDFLVEFKAKDAKNVIRLMGEAGFELTRKFFDPKYAPMLFFRDSENEDVNLEVDIIGAFEDVHLWAIERATRVITKAGIPCPVLFPCAQAEDIVILKASAALSPRRGEKSARDKEAILALAKNGLDTDYIEIVLTQALADYSDEIVLLTELGVLKS